MSRKHPNVPGTGNPFGRGSSVPSLSHRWNRHSRSIQHSINCHLYSTISFLSWPSTYIPFLNFPYVHPRFASHWSANLAEIDTLRRPFHARMACISGLTTIFTTLLAFRFFFSINCALISSATSSSLRIVPRFWSIWWRGRSLHLKYMIAHSRMHRVQCVPCPCALETTSDAFFQEKSRPSLAKRFRSPTTTVTCAQTITLRSPFSASFVS